MKVVSVLLLYVVGALFTFAVIYEAEGEHNRLAAVPAVYGGAAWPLYWGGLGAIEAVRHIKAMPSRDGCSACKGGGQSSPGNYGSLPSGQVQQVPFTLPMSATTATISTLSPISFGYSTLGAYYVCQRQ